MANYRIIRNDGRVVQSGSGINGQIAGTFIDTPASGATYTYTLEVQGNYLAGDSGTYVTLASITALVVKK